MSIGEVGRKRDMRYNARQNIAHSIMSSDNPKNRLLKEEAFKLFASGFVNLEIATLLHISYTEVIALRIKYERRGHK